MLKGVDPRMLGLGHRTEVLLPCFLIRKTTSVIQDSAPLQGPQRQGHTVRAASGGPDKQQARKSKAARQKAPREQRAGVPCCHMLPAPEDGLSSKLIESAVARGH